MGTKFEQAQAYVASTGVNYFVLGRLQLELLKMNGCTSGSHVLEIGCGCLVAGRPIMAYLEPDRYVGIEPNVWLIDAVREGLPDTNSLIEEKRPLFIHNLNFDASMANRAFDFVISHSVLSHAASWQYPLFLQSVNKVLSQKGVVLASIRLHHNNGDWVLRDSNHDEWTYPGVTLFTWDTVERTAIENGFEVEWRPDYRELVTRESPVNFHDWIKLTRSIEPSDCVPAT